MNKLISISQALIALTLLTFCLSCSKKSDPTPVTPVNTDPSLTSVDKTTVINGEIITITGTNFSKNYNGASEIVATNTADATKQVYLFILSRTETKIVAVMTGTGGGSVGTYNLSYFSKSDASTTKSYASTLNVTVKAADAGQFFVSSTFTSSNVSAGTSASFGTKNGSTNMADYSVKLIGYNYETGASTEYNATVTGVTANGYGGSMDLVSFTVPTITAGQYFVKVTYSTSSLAAGWNSVFSIN